MPGPAITAGRSILLLANLFYSAGSFAADWSETHIYNPHWTPHAKFHNGQTMSVGVLLALMSTYLSFRPVFEQLSPKEERFTVWCASMVASFYCLAGVSAIFYPGTHWWDPQYPIDGPVSQREIFSLQVVLVWVAYALEVKRMGKRAKTA